MNFFLVFSGFLLLILFEASDTWNFCYLGKEKEICQDRRHVVCYKDDITKAGTFLDEAPMTYRLMKSLLHKINQLRNDIAGGVTTGLPTAAKMRQLLWDNELEYFAIHRSKTCSIVKSACSATPKYKQAGELNGVFGQDTKPIRFATAFEEIFAGVLKQLIKINSASDFGVDYTKELAENAPDLCLLANDRASRVGCGIVLCTDCSVPEKTLPYCYYLTCVFDVVNEEGCPVYETTTLHAGTKCKEVYGTGPTKDYNNLCPNDGSLNKNIECSGMPNRGKGHGGNGNEGKESQGENLTEDPFVRSSLPIPEKPNDSTLSKRPEEFDAFEDDKFGICQYLTSKKAEPQTKELLRVCWTAPKKKLLRHIACNFPHFEYYGNVIGLYRPDEDEKKYLVDFHNILRNNVASGKEYSTRVKKYFPAASRMREVIWDDELEYLAIFHAKHCHYGHDKCRNTKKFPAIGQNLGRVGFKPQKSHGLNYVGYMSMHAFYEEKNNMTDPLEMPTYYNSTKESAEKFGHFAQLMVDKVSRIGCAYSKCSTYYTGSVLTEKGCFIMTCHYDAMNLFRKGLYKPGPPASDCKSDFNLEVSDKYPHLCKASEEMEPKNIWEKKDVEANQPGFTLEQYIKPNFIASCKKMEFEECS